MCLFWPLEFFARWKCFLGLETFDSPLYPTRNAYAKRRPSHQNGREVISSPWLWMDWGGGCSQPFISSPRPPPALPCTLTTVKKQPLSPQNSGAGVLALASIYLNVELRMKHTKDAVKKDVWHKKCKRCMTKKQATPYLPCLIMVMTIFWVMVLDLEPLKPTLMVIGQPDHKIYVFLTASLRDVCTYK